jgi:hypothetical protein
MRSVNAKLDSRVLDRLAILLSSICAVHCLLLPVALTLLPIMQGSVLDEASFHVLFLFLVVPTSVIALSVGCRTHKNLQTAALGTVGLAILVVTAFWGHDLVGYNGERVMATVGGAILAASHILNYKLCRADSCDHH